MQKSIGRFVCLTQWRKYILRRCKSGTQKRKAVTQNVVFSLSASHELLWSNRYFITGKKYFAVRLLLLLVIRFLFKHRQLIIQHPVEEMVLLLLLCIYSIINVSSRTEILNLDRFISDSI